MNHIKHQEQNIIINVFYNSLSIFLTFVNEIDGKDADFLVEVN